jgi:hypothetical protein
MRLDDLRSFRSNSKFRLTRRLGRQHSGHSRALPDLCLGIVSEVRGTLIPGFLSWSQLLKAPARPGLSFCIARQSGWFFEPEIDHFVMAITSAESQSLAAAIMRARNVPTAIGTKRRAPCSSQSRMTA